MGGGMSNILHSETIPLARFDSAGTLLNGFAAQQEKPPGSSLDGHFMCVA
jgi:hypothetical protein